MSKVRLYGNTSGYVDLQAPDVAGDVTITLPNESGPFATETYVDNAIDTSGGVIIAVKHALFTGTQSASTAAGANFAVTDLSITHETADAANKLIISAFLGAASSSTQKSEVGLAIHDGTNLIDVGTAAGSRTSVGAGGMVTNSGSDQVVTMPSITFVHVPGAGSKTYTVRAVNIDTSTETLHINRAQGDGNFASFPRAVSALVIQEVKV